MEWLPTAQALPINGKKKITHCGSSPSLSLTASLRGWHAYCHRCQFTDFEKRNSMPTAEEIAEGKALLRKMRECRDLPSDFSTVFAMEDPLHVWAMTWLASSGITQSLRTAYSVGISQTYRACIVPVQQLGFIARRYDWHVHRTGPKYVEAVGNAESSVFLSLPERAQASSLPMNAVICEDALSAMKVGELLPAGSLLGTSLGFGKLEQVVKHAGVADPVIGVWQDPDRAGQKSAKAVTQRLELMGIKSVIIHSEKDPKKYSIRQIRSILGDRRSIPADYEVPQPVLATSTDGSRGLV